MNPPHYLHRKNMKSKFFGHLSTITKHRFKVFVYCTKCGLFWRGLVHDLSKFSPVEFFEGVKYYQGTYSPIAKCRKTNGYSKAWIHHKNRNKHHPEYWYDAENQTQMNMPYKYAVESICDRISATKTYFGKDYNSSSPLDYYNKTKHMLQINPRMHSFYHTVLTDLANHGEKYILNKKYMKHTYKNCVEQPLQDNANEY